MDSELLTALRKLSNLNQHEFGNKIGYSQSMIAKIESHERDISKDITEAVKNIYPREHIDAVKRLLGR